MEVRMLVEVKVVGSPVESADRAVSIAGEITLRALLVELVTGEAADYERRRGERLLWHVLTDKQVVAGQRIGRIVSGGRTAPPAPPLAQATERAIEAFNDGLFFVVLDGRQIEDLDTQITVGPASRLRLVRLVALAGG